MKQPTFRDDTPVEVAYLTAATAQVQVRATEYPAPLDEATNIRATLQDGIPRYSPGPIALNIATAGPGGRLEAAAEAVSTWYTVWLIPHPTITDQLSAGLSTNAPSTKPAGYPYAQYVGAIYNDGAGNFIPFAYDGNRCDFWNVISIEAVAAIDGAAVDVDCTAVIPAWSSAVTCYLELIKDAAAGQILAQFWQDDGAAVPAARATVEFSAQLPTAAAIAEDRVQFTLALTGRRGHIWRQRTSGGAAVLTTWTLAARSYWDPFIR